MSLSELKNEYLITWIIEHTYPSFAYVQIGGKCQRLHVHYKLEIRKPAQPQNAADDGDSAG
jgi:hypothetical protein